MRRGLEGAALVVAGCAAQTETPPPLPAPSRIVAADSSAPPQAPADVTIRTDAVLVRNAVVVSLRADRTPNVERKPDGLYLPPLGDALAHHQADGPLVVDVDPTTPFRLLEEVLVTAAQSDRVRWVLRSGGSPQTTISALSPRMRPAQGLGLTVIVIADGIALKGRGGNVAPGCSDTGPGLAIPKASGAFDLVGLRACVRKLKELSPDERYVTVTANADIAFRELVPIVATVRGDSGELFPDVVIGLR